MNFRESSKRPLIPPLIFGKSYCGFPPLQNVSENSSVFVGSSVPKCYYALEEEFDHSVSVFHQNSGDIGKSIRPAERFPEDEAQGKSRGRRGWISQYFPSFGGVRTFSHHQSFFREWIRKSFGRIDSVKTNPSLLMMSTCDMHQHLSPPVVQSTIDNLQHQSPDIIKIRQVIKVVLLQVVKRHK